MDDLPGAVSLARALVALARGHSTGVLQVCSGFDVCRIAVVDGVVRAASSRRDQLALGDVLLRAGDLNEQAHRVALADGPPRGPVGEWLVREGIATRPAVEHALRRQLRARILEVFSWHGLDYGFARGHAEVGVPWVREPIATQDLVLSALRRALGPAESARSLASLRYSKLTLSPLGRALLDGASLWPDEAAMVMLLDRGCDLALIRSATRASPRTLSTLSALVMVTAVSVQGASVSRYQLLLRKQRQLRASASPSELLDLPADAHRDDARRALRRLARLLHPDTFGPDAPSGMRNASSELMSALARAEHQVRTAS